jgi:zinc transport system substrate-binding protein
MRKAIGVALAAAVIGGGCGATVAAGPSGPVLKVVTGVYPLQQAVGQIGQSKVEVTDVVPPGANPLTYQLTPTQVAQVRSADLVVDVGGGFQPSFEEAARGARRVWSMVPEGPKYVWLDPTAMADTVGGLAGAMAAANPSAGAYYRQGERAFADELRSTGIDYESTLSTCPVDVIFTADSAFGAMAQQYGLHSEVLGTDPAPATVASGVEQVTAANATTVFREPWVADAVVMAVASQAHRKVRTLDTLTGPPSGGWPRSATYVTLLEANLGALSTALGCPDQGSGS